MANITDFPQRGGDGIRDDSERRRPRGLALPFIFTLFALILPPTAQAAGARGVIAEQPENLPVSLGNPAGCYWASGRSLNNGSYPNSLVVGGDAACQGSNAMPYYWQNNQWTPSPLPEGNYTLGSITSVSDDLGGGPAFTLEIFNGRRTEPDSGWEAWVQGPGDSLTQLALLEGSGQIDHAVISADGNYIVGGSSGGEEAFRHAVRWAKNGNGWSAPQDLGTGLAVATTASGNIVIGNDLHFAEANCTGGPWVWTDDGGAGSRIDLEPDSQVNDITHDGSLIVGCHRTPCTSGNCVTKPAPAYWVRQSGQWQMHDLEALDGVDGHAKYVAMVGEQAIILGSGFTNQSGGILRAVVWIPNANGSYGAPLRLEALGANFDSWSGATDINRQGIVLGWSEIEPFGGSLPVVWALFDQLPFQINAGISDAWYNPATDGQGFFIIVWENIQFMFLAWFTYDMERPTPNVPTKIGEAGHRWLTAEGNYSDNRAELTAYLSEGGVFDAANPAPVSTPDGTMIVEFENCLSGTVSYDIPSAGVKGVVPIERITDGHVAQCETASAQAQMVLMNSSRE